MTDQQKKLSLVQAQLGPMANFVYIIADPVTRKAAVVDPAWDVSRIIDYAEGKEYDLEKILITHYHQDHIGGNMMGQNIQGAAEMVSRVKAKVYVNIFKVGELEVKFIHTPGHTPGSQCFLVDGNLISGDTLFVNSCGRVDLPGSDPEQMYYSLNHTLRNLDDTTVVYPGHAYAPESSTTIGEQKQHNMYMRFKNLDDFLMAMGYSR
jgi:glyoxylase-like metal-dependent hydrolase (beta-lactamase superfamily II)